VSAPDVLCQTARGINLTVGHLPVPCGAAVAAETEWPSDRRLGLVERVTVGTRSRTRVIGA